MKTEFSLTLPVATLACALAWIINGTHISPQWGVSFATALAIDFTIGVTVHIKMKGKKKHEQNKK